MGTLKQLRDRMTRETSNKLSTLFSKLNRKHYHTNHNRHKGGKSYVNTVIKYTDLYFRIGLVVSVLVSLIAIETSAVSASLEDSSDGTMFKYSQEYSSSSEVNYSRPQYSRSRESLTRRILNKEPNNYESLSNTSSFFAAERQQCAFCTREQRVNYTLDTLKAEILEKLGFAEPPNTTGIKVPHIPPLTTLLEQQRGNPQTTGMLGDQPLTFKSTLSMFEQEDNYAVKTEKIIFLPQLRNATTDMEIIPEKMEILTRISKLRHKVADVLHFKFSNKARKNEIEKARLHFWLRGLDEEDECNPVTVKLYVVSQNDSNNGSYTMNMSYRDKRERSKSLDGEWYSIDVHNVVLQWFKNPSSNFGLVIRAEPIETRRPRSGKPLIPTDISDGGNVPYLEVHTKEKDIHRKKRDLGLTCEEKSTESRCCRYPLTVDFDSFGWTFIIAPRKYEAYYCSGECPYAYLPSNPHTHVIQLAQTKFGPCCAAKKLSPLSMLYFDDTQAIIFGTLPGMVVERCGCT